MTIFGNGEQTRAFSYVGDVIPVMADAIDRPEAYNETFNVGADQWYTVQQVAEYVAEAFGVELRINHLPERLEVKHAYSSHDKAKRKLEVQAQTDLKDGIRRMAGWAREHGPRTSKGFANIEISRNLPPSWQTQ